MKPSLLSVPTLAFALLAGAPAFAATIVCKDAGFHPVSATLCCPEGKVLNKDNKCAYPTKNGCPAGYHPEPRNACCVDGSVLTDDGLCTETGGDYSSGGDDYSGGGNVSIPHPGATNQLPAPAWYPANGSDTCPYGQCECQGYAKNGQVVGAGQTCN